MKYKVPITDENQPSCLDALSIRFVAKQYAKEKVEKVEFEAVVLGSSLHTSFNKQEILQEIEND